jgi:hypothetical protein
VSNASSEALLTATIARMSQRFDDYTNDHYEPETLTLILNGTGSTRLYLPKRILSLTSVATTDYAGNATTQASTVYRLHKSLSGGTERSDVQQDYLEIIGGQYLTGVPQVWGQEYSNGTWPSGEQNVTVVGSFGWTTTPGDVKRAVALMVYLHYKPRDKALWQTQSFSTADATYNLIDPSPNRPTGVKEIDDAIERYRYDPALLVA